MTTTPWEALAAAITRLNDKFGQVPEVREATVMAVGPATVLFDTDTEPTLVHRSLEDTLIIGSRVLTMKLRHYVWILGASSGGVSALTDWDTARAPGFYWANAAAHSPVSAAGVAVTYWVGHVQTMYSPGGDIRILQTVWRPDVPNGPQYQRSFNIVGNGVWSDWVTTETGDGSTASLTTADLDTITMAGIYYQSTYVEATLARHYPDVLAGTLQVINTNSGNYVLQQYTARADAGSSVRVWQRGKFASGAWQPWRITVGEDSGWVDTGKISIATGFSMTGYDIRKVGNEVILRYINFTRTGAAMNGSRGDIGNTTFATITDTDLRPSRGSFMLHTGNSGPVLAGNVDGNGNMIVSAVAAGLTDSSGVIPTNQALSLAGRWIKD